MPFFVWRDARTASVASEGIPKGKPGAVLAFKTAKGKRGDGRPVDDFGA
jgi:hypothetical protein